MLADWRMIVFRAVVAIAFGVITLIWPNVTLWALVVVFGAYALVDGVIVLVGAFSSHVISGGTRAWLVIVGLLGIAAGIVTFVWPDITALALLFVIAFWAIFTGLAEIAAAIEFRKVIEHEWLLGLAGVLSVAFGILLVITPGDGALVITWLIGWYALFFGVMQLSLAWRLHHIETDARSGTTSLGPATA